MLNNKTVAVVVPAYNEERQILSVIENMPDFVDRIVIVNDNSNDSTANVVASYIAKVPKSKLELPCYTYPTGDGARYDRANVVLMEKLASEEALYTRSEIVNKMPDNDRVILINHLDNGGVGAAMATGYKWCRDHAVDCTALMDGDGQMDPSELQSICLPVVAEGVDYVKGNRLGHPSARLMIPLARYFGNSILSILTKVASGYWHVSDTQTGYTAISLNALRRIRLCDIYHSYGRPNDMLVKLNIECCTLHEVVIKPVYNVGERSKMKIWKVIPRVSWLLLKSFFIRLYKKYFWRDFHPLFLLYHSSFLLLLISIPYGYRIMRAVVKGLEIGNLPVLAFLFLFVMGFQFLLFAMWMDIQDNERLNK